MSASSFTIPSVILQQLYTFGSLRNSGAGVQFSVKNRLTDTSIQNVHAVRIDEQHFGVDQISIELPDGRLLAPQQISPENPLFFKLGETVIITAQSAPLQPGKHAIELIIQADYFGELRIQVEDQLSTEERRSVAIPRHQGDDYAEEPIRARQKFVEEFTGIKPNHIAQYSFDPHKAMGNIENFTGVAQIPIGFAGPVLVHGEHANGEFIVPLATTEGTLVASYNRGIKVINMSGGVRSTVVRDAMQRAPVFIFDDARESRNFVAWVEEHMDEIRAAAEATSSVARLQYVDPYLSNKFAYLRFNYHTGDAAGQNMVGKATFAACNWVMANYPEGKIRKFFLESNFATDKKASQVNILHTRGKRVTAEAIVRQDVLKQVMRVDTRSLHYHWGVATVGAFLSGANNNGAHSPNAITAIFIATGQDVANVSESSAAVVYTELLENNDLYMSITIPSLIVATYGGGTGLATQRECLEILGCYGKGKVNKLAEIIGAVVLAGELSLAAAISSSDWVSSHEQYGRNR